MTLLRDGTFSMLAQRSVTGTLDPQPLPLMGTYTLGSACTFQMTFEVGFHFNATVVNWDEIVFVETDTGTALAVRAVRV